MLPWWWWGACGCWIGAAFMYLAAPKRRAARAERRMERRREKYRHGLRCEAEWRLAVEAEMNRLRAGGD